MNGVDGPSPPPPRCPPWGRRGEQATSWRSEPVAPPEEGSLGLGAGPSSPQVCPHALSCVHRVWQVQESSGAWLVDAGLVASAGPCSPEKGLDLCLACARPSARGGSQTELELADTSFQNWGNVVLNIYFLKDTHTHKSVFLRL